MPRSTETPMAALDHYQTLGLKPEASPEAIKKAYRRLARQHHPDLSKAADANARMAAVNEAHEVLSDPELRAAYDARDRVPPAFDRPRRPGPRSATGAAAGAGFTFSDAEAAGFDTSQLHGDFFEQIFGRHGGEARGAPRPRRGSDQHADIELDLQDAYTGTERSFTLRSSAPDEDGRPHTQDRVLMVRIPVGVAEGQQIRLAGSGSAGQGGAPDGDLLLAVHFKPDPRWRAEGRDVLQTLKLAPWEAALGASVSVHTPGGETEVQIPPGTQAGRKLRLKGRGLPAAGRLAAGHVLLTLEVVLPPADTAAGRSAYAAFQSAFQTGTTGFDARSPVAA
jgi:curved DNA-binding protein